MTFIYSRAAAALNQHAANTHRSALIGKRGLSARCSDGWICSDDFTDDDQIFSASAQRGLTQRFPVESTRSGNGLVFQKDADGAWQFTRSNTADGATGPAWPRADHTTYIVIETGFCPVADGGVA